MKKKNEQQKILDEHTLISIAVQNPSINLNDIIPVLKVQGKIISKPKLFHSKPKRKPVVPRHPRNIKFNLELEI